MRNLNSMRTSRRGQDRRMAATVPSTPGCSADPDVRRLSLVVFGEPQMRPECARPLELGRGWRAVGMLAATAIAVAIIWLTSARLGPLAFVIAAGAALAVQAAVRIFAPIRHQSPAAILKRNVMSLAGVVTFLVLGAWLIARVR